MPIHKTTKPVEIEEAEGFACDRCGRNYADLEQGCVIKHLFGNSDEFQDEKTEGRSAPQERGNGTILGCLPGSVEDLPRQIHARMQNSIPSRRCRSSMKYFREWGS